MGFLSPWFLLGAVSVTLPFWIHMLRQYKSTPQPFSSLMFFERRTQSAIRHRRLRYLLLLALRVALLLLMALAFANPFVHRAAAGISGSAVPIFIVDRSFSMRAAGRFVEAKQRALDQIGKLRPGQKAQVIALDSQAHFLTPLTDDPAVLRAAVDGLQPGDERSSYGELARTLRNLSDGLHQSLAVHLFSDQQRSSLAPTFADLQLRAGTDLRFEMPAAGLTPNWAVESVAAPSRVFDGKKSRVQAVVAGYGTDAARRTVSLALDGKVLESRTVEVPPSGRVSVEFASLETPFGLHQGEVRVEGGDRLHEDDKFRFSVERGDPRPVLFLYGGNNSRPVLYYRTALEASPASGFTLEPMPLGQGAAATFSKYAFVVLSDPGTLPGGMEEQLRSYVSGGGSVLIALGPSSAARSSVPVSGEPLHGSLYAARDGEQFQTAGTVDTQNPILLHTNGFEGTRFYQAARVQPGAARVLAKLSDGSPLLYEKTSGEGKILVFTSTFDNLSNDLPLHAAFLPFVEQSARYLGGQEETVRTVTAGAFLPLRSGKETGGAVDATGPDGTRLLTLPEVATARGVAAPLEGFYRLRPANGREVLYAVNADRRESDLESIPAETLSLWQNTGHQEPLDNRGLPQTTAAQQGQWSLWRYALLIVLALALVESLFASRYLAVEKEAA